MESNKGHVQTFAWNNSVPSVEDANFDEEVLMTGNISTNVE
jgi:hypothetical protein